MAARILVIEDDNLSRKLYCELLSAHGFAVVAMPDGRDAPEYARQHEPRVIMLDLRLPYVDGFTVLRAMKQDASIRRIPILAVSVLTSLSDERRARSLGAAEYFRKPVAGLELVAAIKRLDSLERA